MSGLRNQNLSKLFMVTEEGELRLPVLENVAHSMKHHTYN